MGRYRYMSQELLAWARELAEAELAAPLPRRWVHSLGVGRRAAELQQVLGEGVELLAAAAILHDVGYAPRLALTGFHPLDGARFLRDAHGADDRLTRLVAHHSFSVLGAEECGLRETLEAEFPELPDERLADALTYCDMTSTPDGDRTRPEELVAEIAERYGLDSEVGRFIRRAGPLIIAAVARGEAGLAAQPGSG
jgi:hypothetical protein